MHRGPFNAILNMDGKLRSSVYKLYRWLCSKQTKMFDNHTGRYDYSYKLMTVSLDDISKKTGLSKPSIIRARRKLESMKLIAVDEDRGTGGLYRLQAVGTLPDNRLKLHDNTYFPVPKVSMLRNIYCDKWDGTDALVYDYLCSQMNAQQTPVLRFADKHFLKQLSRNTLMKSLRTLGFEVKNGKETGTGFIKVERGSRS
jgi:hypothetical protein